ncbi:MAG: phosphomannomutase/phosphoglucomutase [Gammaproteobacteria bacterium]|nr:phosphomannomutase/phosphoglucomutase [Gammaproteobacteria bacterium]
MNETQAKIRAMIKEESVAKQKEELEERRRKKAHSKEKKAKKILTPQEQERKKLLGSLFYLSLFMLFALGLFYAASITKKSVENRYQQQLETNAIKNLEAVRSQAILTLSYKINNFNYILKDAEYIKHFKNPLWQEVLKADLAARLGDQAVVEIVPTDFDNDEVIDNPELGYAVLSLLNELQQTGNSRSASHLKVEVHRPNSNNARLVLLRKVTYLDADLDKDVVIGYIVASLSPVFLRELIKDFKSQSGYLEIVQQFSGKPSILTKKGDASLKGMPLLISRKINNTQWTFNFWPEAQRNKPSALLLWQSLAFLALGSLAFVSAMVLLILVIKKRRSAFHELLHSLKPRTRLSKSSIIEIDQVKPESVNNTADVQVMNKIFRAYDIRGVVGHYINAEIFRKIAYAIGKEMTLQQQTKIAIAYDGRTSSPQLVKTLTDALLESGINVLDIGMVTSPILYFAAITKADGNGIVVTASHNPANYNGMKIMLAGHSFSADRLQGLKQRVLNNESVMGKKAVAKGNLEQLNVMEDYFTKIMANVILARPMKIVIDTGNGVAGKFASTFFEQLDCKVTALNAEVDGNFPAHDPDPSRPENMTELVQKVTELKADIGIAFDGDGDRLGLVSSGGEIIWPDRILMLLAKDILSRNKEATILYDVKSTAKLESFIRGMGGNPVMCRSGHSFMKSKLLETGALLGGEMSGHIFIKERWFGFDDALFAAARVLEILSIDLRKSRQVFAELPDSLNTPEILIATENGQAIVEKMSADNSAFHDAQLITIDGIRVEYLDGWGLVRASNTSDNLTLRFEADDEVALQRIANVFKEAILAAEPELEFPF